MTWTSPSSSPSSLRTWTSLVGLGLVWLACGLLLYWSLWYVAIGLFCMVRLAALASASFWHLLQSENEFNSGPGNKDVYSVAIPFLSGLYSFKFSFLLLSNFKWTLSLSSEIHVTSTTTSMQDPELLRKHMVGWAFDDLFLCWAWACAVASAHASGVGVVDKPQVCWTENAWFLALVSYFQQFEAHRNQFFNDIYWLIVLLARTYV